MEEVYRGGVLDTVTQALAVTLMSLTPPDVSKVTLGETFYRQYLHLSCKVKDNCSHCWQFLLVFCSNYVEEELRQYVQQIYIFGNVSFT